MGYSPKQAKGFEHPATSGAASTKMNIASYGNGLGRCPKPIFVTKEDIREGYGNPNCREWKALLG
jgi:hypothetical protein